MNPLLLTNMIRVLIYKLRMKSFSAQRILEKNYPPGSDFVFVQVGAFDGIAHDYLYEVVKKLDARGIVIEPLSDVFAVLKENYAYNRKIVPVKKAVHANASEVTLYRVDPVKINALPDWAAGISSIDPDHYKRTGKITSEFMIQEKVPADNLMRMIEEFEIGHDIDLLQIDTEGYDYEVLKQFNFDSHRPKIIRFEYVNLDNNSQKKALQLLRKNHYCYFYEGADIIAVRISKVRL